MHCQIGCDSLVTLNILSRLETFAKEKCASGIILFWFCTLSIWTLDSWLFGQCIASRLVVTRSAGAMRLAVQGWLCLGSMLIQWFCCDLFLWDVQLVQYKIWIVKIGWIRSCKLYFIWLWLITLDSFAMISFEHLLVYLVNSMTWITWVKLVSCLSFVAYMIDIEDDLIKFFLWNLCLIRWKCHKTSIFTNRNIFRLHLPRCSVSQIRLDYIFLCLESMALFGWIWTLLK